MAEVVVFRNPLDDTRWRASGNNIALLTSWGWVPVDDPDPEFYDPFPGYLTGSELDAAVATEVADDASSTAVALRAAFGPRRRRAASALAALRSVSARGISLRNAYPVTADAPTVTHGTSDTITSNFAQVSAADVSGRRWTPIGTAASEWDAVNGYLHQRTNGLD